MMPQLQANSLHAGQTDRPSLIELIEDERLTAVFQPVVSMQSAQIIGYEGLIRGPEGSALAMPDALFAEAGRLDCIGALEKACRRIVSRRFMQLGLTGRLFLNLLPSTLLNPRNTQDTVLQFLDEIGLRPERIVLEITESQPLHDLAAARAVVAQLRSLGFSIGIDDLGEGFASLKLWSELRPEFVKIDKHFVQALNADSFKLQFVRAIHEISMFTGTSVIAEGIETQNEFRVVRDLGIEYGQGYLIGRPAADPAREPCAVVQEMLVRPEIAITSVAHASIKRSYTVGRLVTLTEPVGPLTTNRDVLRQFDADPALGSIPVVLEGIPIGLVRRARLVQEFSRQFRHELFDHRACTLFMDNDPLIVESDRSLHEVGTLITEMDRRHLASGFIIVDQGRYLGMGSGQALVRELTQLQITAARHSNPLTLLPGNVPIEEHVTRLLGAGTRFVACYCDIDNFKPYNDVYGYHKGDEMIRMVAGVLTEHGDASMDFIGHIGGDDFTVHLQSTDWEDRCQRILDGFSAQLGRMLTPMDVERKGYRSEGRGGEESFFPLPTLSIGAVLVEPGHFTSFAEVAAAMAVAKKEAKRITGNALFIERRKPRMSI